MSNCVKIKEETIDDIIKVMQDHGFKAIYSCDTGKIKAFRYYSFFANYPNIVFNIDNQGILEIDLKHLKFGSNKNNSKKALSVLCELIKLGFIDVTME